jgi:pyruvate dehydrogenase E2 component (dihydrolipoamide acetyltransferase)
MPFATGNWELKTDKHPQMATTIEVPQLGNTVEECLVTRWFKRKGDPVAAGEVVAEIETDKTTFEITSPVDGQVLEIYVEEGAAVPVFSRLLVVGTDSEALDAPTASVAPVAPVAPIAPVHLAPRAPVAPGAPLAPGAASPRARRLASHRGVDLTAVIGSGPGGRVIERDVLGARATVTAAVPQGLPLSPTRHAIARRTRESLAATAQYTLQTSADARGLLAARARLKSVHGTSITIVDLLNFCLVRALRDSPGINAELVGGRIVQHADVHLGFACDTAKGLVAPVVRDAHTLSLAALASRARTLAGQALAGTIAPSELAGATFTVSHLGSLGIEWFTPVVNPPQVAILGVGAIHPKPVRVADAIEFIDVLPLSLTCDHQVIDGAPGARFLQVLSAAIQDVESFME